MLELKLNQRIQLKKILLPVADMTAMATLHYKPDGIAFTATDGSFCNIIVWIRITSSAVDYLRCDAYSSVGIDARGLLMILDDAGEEGSIVIRIDDAKEIIYFSFVDDTGDSIDAEMVLSEPTDPSLVIKAMDQNFKAVAGIPAEEFERVLRLADVFGKIVHIYITKYRVMCKGGFGDIVLAKKKCSISGVGENETYELEIRLRQKTSFLNAALLSDTVWILFPSPQTSDTSFVITCPVEKRASITYFFT